MTADVQIRSTADGGYLLDAELWIARPREIVFPFFADAFNLEQITPPFLNFRVVTPAPIDMRQGTRIDYRLRLHGIPLRWQSEIPVWEPPYRFVDEQRRGPYRTWVHEHTFGERDNGTVVRDRVKYRVWGGGLVHAVLVRRDVLSIFRYRQQRLIELFGVTPPPQSPRAR